MKHLRSTVDYIRVLCLAGLTFFFSIYIFIIKYSHCHLKDVKCDVWRPIRYILYLLQTCFVHVIFDDDADDDGKMLFNALHFFEKYTRERFMCLIVNLLLLHASKTSKQYFILNVKYKKKKDDEIKFDNKTFSNNKQYSQ